MSNPIPIVRKGMSLPFVFDRAGKTIAGWVCTITVKEFKNNAAIFSRVIPEDATLDPPGWSGFLTSTETDTLTTDTLYRLIGVLTNSVTDEEEQIVKRFNLTQTWA